MIRLEVFMVSGEKQIDGSLLKVGRMEMLQRKEFLQPQSGRPGSDVSVILVNQLRNKLDSSS